MFNINYSVFRFYKIITKTYCQKLLKIKVFIKQNTKSNSSIDFINHALFHQITRTFEKIKGHFGSLKDKYSSEKSILVLQLVEHKMYLKKQCSSQILITTQLKNKVGLILYRYIWSRILKSLRRTSIMQLRCKNKRLHNLTTSRPNKLIHRKFRYGSHYRFLDKNKDVKRNVPT